MREILTIAFIICVAFTGTSQSDTVNQVDDQGRKQGYWITYGKDKPEKGYCSNCPIENGIYKDNRKHGPWTRYHRDSGLVKLNFQYLNNRPIGYYEKFYVNQQIMERGTFIRNRQIDDYERFYESGCLQVYKFFNKNGKADSISIYYFDGCDTSISNQGQIELIFNLKDGIETDTAYRYYPNGDLKQILVFDTLGNTSHQEKFDRVHDEKYPPYQIDPIPTPKPPKKKDSNGECILLGRNKEISFEGECKDGKPWNGRSYVYDENGLLEYIDILKNGKYYSSEKLD